MLGLRAGLRENLERVDDVDEGVAVMMERVVMVDGRGGGVGSDVDVDVDVDCVRVTVMVGVEISGVGVMVT